MQRPKIQTAGAARSTKRQSALISRICSMVRARDSSSSGLATTTARHIARDTATLSRLREKRNLQRARHVLGARRRHRVEDDRRRRAQQRYASVPPRCSRARFVASDLLGESGDAMRWRAHRAPGLQASNGYFTSPVAVIVSRLMSQPCPTATSCFSSLVWS